MSEEKNEGESEKEESGGDSGYILGVLKFSVKTIFVMFILIGIPFLISGVWPPYVTVVSDSMHPNISKGDFVYVVEQDRFSNGDSIHGIQTSNLSDGGGDVIVYKPNGNESRTPVIHRAIRYVDEGENWVEDVDEEHVRYDSCNLVRNCPAENSGFITLGDANDRYDQVSGISAPVKQEWIVGKHKLNIPNLGWLSIEINS